MVTGPSTARNLAANPVHASPWREEVPVLRHHPSLPGIRPHMLTGLPLSPFSPALLQVPCLVLPPAAQRWPLTFAAGLMAPARIPPSACLSLRATAAEPTDGEAVKALPSQGCAEGPDSKQ